MSARDLFIYLFTICAAEWSIQVPELNIMLSLYLVQSLLVFQETAGLVVNSWDLDQTAFCGVLSGSTLFSQGFFCHNTKVKCGKVRSGLRVSILKLGFKGVYIIFLILLQSMFLVEIWKHIRFFIWKFSFSSSIELGCKIFIGVFIIVSKQLNEW